MHFSYSLIFSFRLLSFQLENQIEFLSQRPIFICIKLSIHNCVTLNRPAMPFGNRNKIEDLFSSVLSQLKNITPLETRNNLDIFQSLKLRNLMGKIFRISLKLNFAPNTLGYGLNMTLFTVNGVFPIEKSTFFLCGQVLWRCS